MQRYDDFHWMLILIVITRQQISNMLHVKNAIHLYKKIKRKEKYGALLLTFFFLLALLNSINDKKKVYHQDRWMRDEVLYKITR
jgi:hypothetical protein